MTEVLLGAAGGRLERVLEVGTGSGYQTSILAQLVDQVYSVERIKPLQDKARERLRQLGLHNVQLRHADGGFGWRSEERRVGKECRCRWWGWDWKARRGE